MVMEKMLSFRLDIVRTLTQGGNLRKDTGIW